MDFLANPTGPHTSSLALSVTRMERPLPGCTGTAVQEGGAHRLPSCPPRPALLQAELEKQRPSRQWFTQLHQSHLEELAKPRPHSAFHQIRMEGLGKQGGWLLCSPSRPMHLWLGGAGHPRPQVLC